MHYLYLLAVSVPPQELDIAQDRSIAETIKLLSEKRAAGTATLMEEIKLDYSRGLQTPFARAVNEAADLILKLYWTECEDSEWCEFVDRTEELRREYDNDTALCVRFPDGQIVHPWDSSFCNDFCVYNGVVFQKKAGKLQHRKRTKKARKMTVLKKYPYKKLYASFKDYAEAHSTYDPDEEAYGYRYNPDAFYDWYSIGGRWPMTFLVRDDCQEYSIGVRDTAYDSYDTPNGYRWVAAARKKDICWESMHDWTLSSAKAGYAMLKECFETKVLPAKCYWRITDTGVEGIGVLYIAGETLDEYLERVGINSRLNACIRAYGFVDKNGWNSSDDFSDWQAEIIQRIEDLDDDDVLVAIDCHL